MTIFNEEKNKIEQELWASTGIKPGNSVLDIGLGNRPHSAIKLLELGANVTVLEKSIEAIRRNCELDLKIVEGDITSTDFCDNEFDYAVAYFILHEIPEELHISAVKELLRVSGKVIIAEPTPGTDPVYKDYYRIFQDVMKVRSGIEEYQNLEYWRKILQSAGAKELKTVTKVSKEKITGEEAEEFMNNLIEYLESLDMPSGILERAEELKIKMIRLGMLYSEINLFIAES
ncbi:MAG: class I SAM-dependent methyltransferase [bacterium]|nr:class I SAM-dependent methyltransferase [bacterium]